jgi:putative FmdB family regulatory protein
MPIYDYRCDHCGHAFSQVQSYKDDPVEKCPNCGKKPRRLIVPAAIVFKGSGWYKTDSRPAEKAESKSESKSDKSESKSDKSETKSDTKSETKSDTKSAPKPAEKGSPKSEASS